MEEIPSKEASDLATRRCGNRCITVHVALLHGNRILFVHNKAKDLGFTEERYDVRTIATKPDGWGLITGSVWKQETPIQAALREAVEETAPRYGKDFFSKENVTLNPEPVYATRDGEHITLTFVATLDSFLRIPRSWKVDDSAGGVIEAAWHPADRPLARALDKRWFRGRWFYSGHARILEKFGVLAQ
jgi:8-oxo-dGTP pyrophosphatase MutT (NUDIX family)